MKLDEHIPPYWGVPQKQSRLKDDVVPSAKARLWKSCWVSVLLFLTSWLLWRWLVVTPLRWILGQDWLRVPTEAGQVIDAAGVLAVGALLFWLTTRAGRERIVMTPQEEAKMKQRWESLTGQPWDDDPPPAPMRQQLIPWIGALVVLAAAYFTILRPVLRVVDFGPRWSVAAMKSADAEAWAQWDAWEKRAQTDGRLKTSLSAVKTVSRDMGFRGWNAPARFIVFDFSYEEIIAFRNSLRNSMDIPDDVLDRIEKTMPAWFPRE